MLGFEASAAVFELMGFLILSRKVLPLKVREMIQEIVFGLGSIVVAKIDNGLLGWNEGLGLAATNIGFQPSHKEDSAVAMAL